MGCILEQLHLGSSASPKTIIPTMHEDTSSESHPLEQSEPCPTPLAWQEVVQQFDQESLQQTFDAEYCEIDVIEFGSGPPILFLPGVLGAPRLFALLAWLLRDEKRCVLVSHPRWKRQPPPRRLISESTELIAAVAKHAAPDGLDVYASSFGGQLALDFMHRHPHLVRRSILQSSWAWRSLTVTERCLLNLGKHVTLPIQKVPLWLPAQIQNHRMWFPPYDESRFGFLLNQTYQTPARDVARRLLAAWATDLRPIAGTIEHEIQILRCEGDGKRIGQAEEELQRLLPNVSTHEMHTTGLFPFLTHPHRLVKLLRECFS